MYNDIKKIRLILLLVSFTLFNHFILYGQNDSIGVTPSIVSFSDKINITIDLNSQSDSYTFSFDQDDDFHITTNNPTKFALSLDYEFIGLSLAYAPDFFITNKDDEQKGKSSFTEYQFRFFHRKWIQKIRYQRVKGFYVENSEDFISDWLIEPKEYIQFPNFKTILWEGETSYVFHPGFSFRNVSYNTEWQQKSAGSFIPSLRYRYLRYSFRVDDLSFLQNNYELSLSASYYYTLVLHKNWFISSHLSPSFGIRLAIDEKTADLPKEKNIYYPIQVKTGLQIGYSSKKLFFGAQINISSSTYNEDQTTNITKDKLYSKIYLGLRFNAPNFIQKEMKKFYQKIGM